MLEDLHLNRRHIMLQDNRICVTVSVVRVELLLTEIALSRHSQMSAYKYMRDFTNCLKSVSGVS